MVLDRPVSEGDAGGHGAIRYRVAEYESGTKVRSVFDPTTGIDGAHELSPNELSDGRYRMRHVLAGRTRGHMRLLFFLAVELLRDAVVEDMSDNAKHEAAGTLACPAGWSPRVRLLRRLFREGRLAADNKQGRRPAKRAICARRVTRSP